MLGLTRSTNCYPQRIRVLGLITDYEIGDDLESTEIPLLDKLINSWEHVKQMELKMEGQFIGYRGYTVQMSKGVSSANCIHIEGINFMADQTTALPVQPQRGGDRRCRAHQLWCGHDGRADAGVRADDHGRETVGDGVLLPYAFPTGVRNRDFFCAAKPRDAVGDGDVTEPV